MTMTDIERSLIAAPLILPDELRGMPVVASVSGGKDSTALVLALRRAGIPARYVFADTGWEADETYRYLDLLRDRLSIAIDVVKAERIAGLEDRIRSTVGLPPRWRESAMMERIVQRAGFPARIQRWCTRELKLEPLRKYHDMIEATEGVETVSAIGVRGDESEDRATHAVVDDSSEWGGWVWRPLHAWSVENVIMEHRLAGVPVNPLYQDGHDRVGCYPCIYARKEEIRLVSTRAPKRIDTIRDLEGWATAERVLCNADEPDRYSHPQATYFQTRNGRRVMMCKIDHDHGDGSSCKVVRALVGSTPMDIDQIVAWSNTAHGGKHGLDLLAKRPRGGCMRWGLCETGAGAADGSDD